MRIRALLVAMTLGALGLGLPVTPAQADTGVLRPAEENLFPEGVAWDGSRQALLVGSFTSPARITAVDRAGRTRTVVTDRGVPGFLGMKVDAVRHRIVAAYGDPRLPGPTGLAVYDLRTGARQRLVDLSGGGRAVNDVALDPAGNAYVTDTSVGAVYRVDVRGRVSTLVSDSRLGPSIGANGIVWQPGGAVVVANYTTGRLFRFARGRLTEVRLPRPLVGADGMALRPDGVLVVVTNALAGAPGSRPAVHELALRGGVGTPLRTTAWPDPSPTTAAVTPYGTYVLDGHLDAFLAGGTAEDVVLRRL